MGWASGVLPWRSAGCALDRASVAWRQVGLGFFSLRSLPPFSPPLLPASHSSFPPHRLSHAQSSWCVTDIQEAFSMTGSPGSADDGTMNLRTEKTGRFQCARLCRLCRLWKWTSAYAACGTKSKAALVCVPLLAGGKRFQDSRALSPSSIRQVCVAIVEDRAHRHSCAPYESGVLETPVSVHSGIGLKRSTVLVIEDHFDSMNTSCKGRMAILRSRLRLLSCLCEGWLVEKRGSSKKSSAKFKA